METYAVTTIVASALQMGKLNDLPKLISSWNQSLNQDLPAFKAHCLKRSLLFTASLKFPSNINHLCLTVSLTYIKY